MSDPGRLVIHEQLGDAGLESEAKTPCFSGTPQNVVLPVVLSSLECSIFSDLATLWPELNSEQRRQVLETARGLVRPPE